MKRELLLLEHRVQRHDDSAALPGAERGYHQLRNILQVERDAIAGANTAAFEHRCKSGGQSIEFGEGHDAVEVTDCRCVWPSLRRGFEAIDHAFGWKGKRRRNPRWIRGQPTVFAISA